MIRKVRLDDAPAIANIYNPFITQTTVSFETEEVSTEQMAQRIADISAHYPYYVYEEDDEYGQAAGEDTFDYVAEEGSLDDGFITQDIDEDSDFYADKDEEEDFDIDFNENDADDTFDGE